jgi:hypothetical protein
MNHEAKLAYLEENLGKTILPLSIFENEDWPGNEPIEVLLFYKKEWSNEEVKESFLKVTEYYNLFSSRLIMIDDNKFALNYCTDGVKFTFLPPVDDTFDNVNIDDIRKRMVKVKTLPGEPLLSLTVIPVKDGKLGGVSCSHTIGDGISLILFLMTWGCIIEGKDFPLPSTQRLFTGKPVSPDKIDKVFTPPLSELSKKIQNRVNASNVELYSKREYFSDEFFNEHKNKAKLENEKYIISSNQIMTSYLLKKYHDRILPDTDRIRIKIPIDLREIHPDIDSLYIGNAVFDSFTEFTKDEINKMSMYEIAYRLKESTINARNKNHIKEISYLSKFGIAFYDDLFKNRPAFADMDTDIVSSNLTHMNDLGSLGIGEDKGRFVYIGIPTQTSFVMLKEKDGRLWAQITSRYPLV